MIFRMAFATLLVTSIALSAQTQSGDAVWKQLDAKEVDVLGFQPGLPTTRVLAAFALSPTRLESILKAAPREFTEDSKNKTTILFIPFPDGNFERFRIEESPVIDTPLESHGNETQTFKGVGIDDPSATIRFEKAFDGFHAMVRSALGTFYIDPASTKEKRNNAGTYFSYFASARPAATHRLHCEVSGEKAKAARERMTAGRRPVPRQTQAQGISFFPQDIRVYKIALAANSFYAQAVYDSSLSASTYDQAASAMTRTINRINEIYESEIGIHLQMVPDEAKIIYTDPTTDPYRGVNSDANSALAVNQKNLDTVIGNANYDIGHLFTTSTAGLASVGAVCNPNYKAQGVTGIATPTGDDFDVDYVSHEIGHQFGANHTFNAISGYCNGNRNADTAYEPGSGSTIMGYAGNGICDPESLQQHSDPYFHIASLIEIRDYITDNTPGSGGSCGSLAPTSNASLPVPKSAMYAVPKATPFLLSETSTSGVPTPVLFAWEEFDLGDPAPPDNEDGPNATPRPLFRSRPPGGDGVRYFPDYANLILAPSVPALGEALPMLSRTMKFRITTRNNRGGFSANDVTVTVDSGSGPFKILPSTGGSTWQRGSVHTLKWDQANTDKPPLNCKRLILQIITDNDPTKPFTLAKDVPNTGSYDLTVPSSTPLSAHARVIVKAEEGIFFAVSPTDVQITPRP